MLLFTIVSECSFIGQPECIRPLPNVSTHMYPSTPPPFTVYAHLNVSAYLDVSVHLDISGHLNVSIRMNVFMEVPVHINVASLIVTAPLNVL